MTNHVPSNDQLINQAWQGLKPLNKNSHKGQNGKLLIIGGSRLFHAASKWSLDIASKLVDMVFYSSVPSNNRLLSRLQTQELDQQLVNTAKSHFWQGIVVSRHHLAEYITEADCVLIGPGMERSRYTKKLVDRLLRRYPQQKWVVDAGALQMVEPQLLNQQCIITPHHQEIRLLANKDQRFDPSHYQAPATCLLKGPIDQIFYQDQTHTRQQINISGGNPGMTKGGTGDVLAGLLAALYCRNDQLTSAVVASQVNKLTGDKLYQQVGPHFNASDLLNTIPQVLWQLSQEKNKKSSKKTKA